MKIKLDENLPYDLGNVLQGLGHDTRTVHEENLVGAPDCSIWDGAQAEGRFLLTQDLDFSDVRKFSPGSHCGILLVRLRQPSRANLIARIRGIFLSETVQDWSGCFVIATERKMRVLKP
jgi:predicted nuclease of predicted toxin-antitoxin system